MVPGAPRLRHPAARAGFPDEISVRVKLVRSGGDPRLRVLKLRAQPDHRRRTHDPGGCDGPERYPSSM